MDNYQYLVIAGNPVDGFAFYGPFIDFDSAVEWTERHAKNTDSWVATLETPE